MVANHRWSMGAPPERRTNGRPNETEKRPRSQGMGRADSGGLVHPEATPIGRKRTATASRARWSSDCRAGVRRDVRWA
jgi:hypothetical protein